MDYEWDPAKARANLAKHGVSFADAALALEDELALTIRAERGKAEARFVTMGVDPLGRLLVVAHTPRRDAIRIISARRATRQERRRYEEAP
ncbi:MAG TPA: BrnT family toxin [Thermoanaerobaculia bacterium]|nr:BrnT family toxin [Thermoanaerobaculia bacterium]